MVKKLAALILAAVLALSLNPGAALAFGDSGVLKIGDSDEYVSMLQERLRELGYLSAQPTGYFGTVTQQAVIDYQEDHDLKADGKAGPQTLHSIMGSRFTLPPNRSGSVTDADACCPGDRGSAVTALQQRLYDLEYYSYPTITGYYGPVTQQAVKRFQRSHGLAADGIAGTETLSLLTSGKAQHFCLYPGDRGHDVRTLQKRLKELGYFSGGVTGYFGTATQKALKEFQAQNGLPADALAGKNTRALLNAKAAPRWDGISRMSGFVSSASPESPVDKMLEFASAQTGKKYVYLAQGPGAFDSSGFIAYVLRYMGISTPRLGAAGLSAVDKWVKISEMSALLPGDLLFFQSEKTRKITHAGIYLGDSQFIHASSQAGCVKLSRLSGHFARSFSTARRVF